MSVGDNIKKRRYELRMSQQELALAMGYKTRSTIAKIESGENDVSQKKLQKFAMVLDTTVANLVSGYDNEITIVISDIEEGRRNKNIVVILAGGKTGKNRQNIPSQFINVGGKPVIVYPMEVYQSHPAIDEIYIVCLKGWENIVKAYAGQYGITKLKGIVPAGISGVSSFKNALDYLNTKFSDEDYVIIQEATRPLVTTETVSVLLRDAQEKGSATACHLMNDYVQFNMSTLAPRYIDRDTTVAMQSPEVHKISIMNEVFAKAEKKGHSLSETCCTMLMYNLGFKVNFVETAVNNIKISREQDLAAFSAIIKSQEQ